MYENNNTHTHTSSDFWCRWKRGARGEKVEREGKSVMEFVAIRRGDTGAWAIPGVSEAPLVSERQWLSISLSLSLTHTLTRWLTHSLSLSHTHTLSLSLSLSHAHPHREW